MRIGSRIAIGYGILLVLVAALAGVGGWQLSGIGSQLGQMSFLAGGVRYVLEVTQDLSAMRAAALELETYSDSKAADKFTAAATQAEQTLATMVTTARPERRKVYQDLAASIGPVRDLFKQLADATASTAAARGKLVTDGDALSDAAMKLMDVAAGSGDDALVLAAQQVMLSIAQTEVAGWRIVAANDSETLGKARKSAAKVLAQLAHFEGIASSAHDLVAGAKAALADYTAAFEALSAGVSARDDLFKAKLEPAIEAIERPLVDGRASLLSRFAESNEATGNLTAQTITTQGVVAGVAILLGIALSVLIGRGIVRPVVAMTGAMTELASGNSDIAIPALDRKDELGRMAAAVQVFKDNKQTADRLAADQEAQRRLREQRAARLESLTQSFETLAGNLVGLVASASGELQATAQAMTGTAAQTTDRTATVAAAAAEASANVQTVAASAEGLAGSIAEIARQVAQSNAVAERAKGDAQRTNEVVRALAEGAQRIGDVIALINSIAGQTNLLALNATIEAARAGDAGKGFAVVASEVKSLATQTAKATGDIGQQIQQIQAATRQAVESIEAIGATIGEMSGIAAAIAAAVEEQSKSTQEIARNVQQAAAGTRDVTENISGVRAGAGETSASASKVLGASQGLSRQAEQLSTEVGKFVAAVKAA